MKWSLLAAAILMCGPVQYAFSQTVDVVTYTSAENQRLQCDISGAVTVQWIDQTEDSIVPIISHIPSTGSETVESTDHKYDNFAFEASESSYDLIIDNVDKDDEGSYRCTLIPDSPAAAYGVIVEVPTDSISLSCSSCTEANSACVCQCSASGGFSPSLLRLEWKISDTALENQPPTENSTNRGQTIYSSSAVIPVNQDDSVVTCTVTGFVNQHEIESRFPSRLVAEQTLRIRTLPPATTDTMAGEGFSQRSASGLIAICCVEGVVIIVMIFVFCFLYTYRKGSRKEDLQSFASHVYDATDKANTAYMDLQETTQLSSSHVNVDIPLANLNLQAPFPTKGLMKYRKAQMTLTSKREEIVVKTVSDDAPVRLAKLQADEVRKLATLSSNANVAQFIGRCNNVPNLLCYQFVNGTKLRMYLRDNFQPSKIHQYDNTKQKRYHVPEKGSVESLPRVALQIARGMKYLTAQKFLHPGLRSEKVIIDMSGQCKLYDFVSEDNAKDSIAILWNKSLPYQWMPPEYLFLEKLGPSVDVWSFGILMWEIFSYGALPYEGKSRNDVEKALRGKENLPLPNNCPGAIWQITLNCWDQSPEKRPSFDHLYLQISHMCNDNKKYYEIQST